MAKKLGYTWYPNNWRASDRVLKLSLSERGLYRELIDMAYINGNKIVYDTEIFAKRFNSTVKEIKKIIQKLNEIIDYDGEPLVVLEGDIITVPSCNERLAITDKNKNNGAKGGAPSGNKNASKKTTESDDLGCFENNPKTTDALFLKQGKEKEKYKREGEGESKIQPKVSPPPASEINFLSPADLHLSVSCEKAKDMFFAATQYQRSIELLLMDPGNDIKSIDALRQKADDFNNTLDLSKQQRSLSEWADHFWKWLKKYGLNSSNDTGSQNNDLADAWNKKVQKHMQKNG